MKNKIKSSGKSNTKSMDIFETKPGDKVRFYTLQAGYDLEKEDINKKLTLGQEYEVKKIVINNWSTDVYLKGYEEYPFNSVFFQNV
jgi:hypothetical protein